MHNEREKDLEGNHITVSMCNGAENWCVHHFVLKFPRPFVKA